MEQLSMNVSAQRPVIEAEIVTLQPELAADLERLRYLVFQGQKGRDGADGKNYGIVVDGTVDEVLKLKSVEVPGAGAFGWQPISREDLILEADLNVRSIESVSAFYCAALGLVRIAVRAVHLGGRRNRPIMRAEEKPGMAEIERSHPRIHRAHELATELLGVRYQLVRAS